MTELLVFVLSVFGIAWGAGHAELSYPIRSRLARSGRFGALIVSGLECVGCISFHLGYLAFFLSKNGVSWLPTELFHHWWEAAFVSSASSLILAKASGLFDSAPPEGGGAHDRRGEAGDPPAGGGGRPEIG